ncbi:MAG: hypothetical protein LBN95_13655 [Prevotellaceae bacterium]|jgi:LEA14-like dessication related protein|nr:hypothetical protein [Prevotellaceae bacterium]
MKKTVFIVGTVATLFYLYGKTAWAALKLEFKFITARLVNWNNDLISLMVKFEITNPTIFNVFVYTADFDVFINSDFVGTVKAPINQELKSKWIQPVELLLEVNYKDALKSIWDILKSFSLTNWLITLKGTVKADNVIVPLKLEFTIKDFLPTQQ